MTRVLVAGSRVRSERSDAETRPLLAALAARGVDAVDLPWDEPDETADWAGADLVVVRTTWDYTERRDAFLAWAARVEAGTRLQNPLAVLEWNSHKRYLVELAEAGVPVVPTTLLPQGRSPGPLPPGPLVVKPAVSAGGARHPPRRRRRPRRGHRRPPGHGRRPRPARGREHRA